MIQDRRPVSAGELAEFVYCNRAWWLKAVKKMTVGRAALRRQEAGNEWHWRQGKTIARADGQSSAGYAALAIAVLLLACWAWGAIR